MQLRIAGVVAESAVDGPGLRMTVFTQGCSRHCPDCHNPHTHDPDGGTWADTAELLARFEANPLLCGLTVSGGEPFLQAAAVAELAMDIKKLGKTIVLYSGYTFEELQTLSQKDVNVARLLAYTDILIDGPFLKAERDLNLAFRGSRNQRIIELTQQGRE
ncbi:MAG: radical SAM protein [Firmicutes bacterium]|nr:radical SAM protein [Bacillota bacterium]